MIAFPHVRNCMLPASIPAVSAVSAAGAIWLLPSKPVRSTATVVQPTSAQPIITWILLRRRRWWRKWACAAPVSYSGQQGRLICRCCLEFSQNIDIYLWHDLKVVDLSSAYACISLNKSGNIIGKGGSIIRQTRQTTQCHIKIMDAEPGARDRMVRTLIWKGEQDNDYEMWFNIGYTQWYRGASPKRLLHNSWPGVHIILIEQVAWFSCLIFEAR